MGQKEIIEKRGMKLYRKGVKMENTDNEYVKQKKKQTSQRPRIINDTIQKSNREKNNK